MTFIHTKINLFVDKCRRVELPNEALARAFPVILKGLTAAFYVNTLASKDLTYVNLTNAIRQHFEPDSVLNGYRMEWQALSMLSYIEKNPDKSRQDCLIMLTNQIQELHQGLFDHETSGLQDMRQALLLAVSSVPKCASALLRPAETFPKLVGELRQALAIHERLKPAQSAAFATDREFRGNHDNRRYGSRRPPFQGNRGSRPQRSDRYQKRYFVCNKPRCWSTNHSSEERKKAYDRWSSYKSSPRQPNKQAYHAFLAECEGVPKDHQQTALKQFYYSDGDEQSAAELSEDNEEDECFLATEHAAVELFSATANPVSPTQVLSCLQDASLRRALTGKLPISQKPPPTAAVFACEERYSKHAFRGILPDTCAASTSSASLPQAKALIALLPSLSIEEGPPTVVNFGASSAASLSTLRVPTILGTIAFRVLPTSTPFLLSITDMDRLQIRLDNVNNVLIQGDKKIPVTRRWGHP